jgi:hypothetical protein
MFWLCLHPAQAQVTLDGTHCVIFEGVPKGELVRCAVREGENHVLTIALVGRYPNRVEEIVLSLNGRPPFQRLKLSALPLISRTDVGLLREDFNFDGASDLAIMEQAGKMGFLYYLFDAASGRFLPNAELAAIASPQFDGARKLIRSRWSRGGISGDDSYVWEGDRPVLAERLSRDSRGGRCVEARHERRNGRLELVETLPCR